MLEMALEFSFVFKNRSLKLMQIHAVQLYLRIRLSFSSTELHIFVRILLYKGNSTGTVKD